MLARPQETGCSVIDVVRMSVPWNARFQPVKMRFWDSFPHGVETIFFEIWKFSQTAGFWGLPIFLRQTYEGLSSDPDFILTKVGKKPTTMGLFYGTGMYSSITKMTAYFPKQVYLYGFLLLWKGCVPGPHDFGSVPKLAFLGLWVLWAAWFYTCLLLVSHLSHTVFLCAVGALGCTILHLSLTCLPLSPTCLPLGALAAWFCICPLFVSHAFPATLWVPWRILLHLSSTSPLSIFGLRVFSQYGASGCTWPILFAKGVSLLRAKRARSLEWKNFLCNHWSPTSLLFAPEFWRTNCLYLSPTVFCFCLCAVLDMSHLSATSLRPWFPFQLPSLLGYFLLLHRSYDGRRLTCPSFAWGQRRFIVFFPKMGCQISFFTLGFLGRWLLNKPIATERTSYAWGQQQNLRTAKVIPYDSRRLWLNSKPNPLLKPPWLAWKRPAVSVWHQAFALGPGAIRCHLPCWAVMSVRASMMSSWMCWVNGFYQFNHWVKPPGLVNFFGIAQFFIEHVLFAYDFGS